MTAKTTEEEPRWTSDHLLTEDGVRAYSEQLRMMFRLYAQDFRTLATEVRDDYLADPAAGDRWPMTNLHARQLASGLKEMERHAQAIVKAAKRLEAGHRKVRIELPQARAERALRRKAKKRRMLDRGGAAEQLPGGVTGRVAAAASGQPLPARREGDGAGPGSTPFSELMRKSG
ncbi:hypothetical protein ACFC1B_07150 [Streptomyces xiamenensis]|uniref:hypothetical protein n=1 Tax=Streptomyces xiamenensis TaxID=408015 RepID=UPI0035D7F6D1